VQRKRIVIAASAVLDGKPGAARHSDCVEGSKIVAIDQSRAVDYDMHGLTVLPGWMTRSAHHMALR